MAKYIVNRTYNYSEDAYGPFSSLADAKTFVNLILQKDLKIYKTSHTNFIHNIDYTKSSNYGAQLDFDLDYDGHQTIYYDILKLICPEV